MADNIYCYPNTNILINKLNIHDQGQLLDAETRIVSIRLYQLYEHPIVGNYDFKHLCSIHNYIFQDLYSWAGKPRTVDIAKGNSLFCPSWNIYGYADDVFWNFYNNCLNSSNSRELFISSFASYYADLNALHPFREGNGRSQREFCRELFLQCGYLFDLTYTCRAEMIQASIESLEKGDNAKLEAIFRKCIMPLHS